MSALSKEPITGHATFVLLYMKQLNFASAVSTLRPPDLLKFIRITMETCQRVAEKTHGTLIRLQGDCIIAWNEDDLQSSTVNYKDTGKILLTEVRESTMGLANETGFPVKISISIVRGACVFERKANEYTRLVGDAMNRVARLADSARDNAIIIDDSVEDRRTVGD